MRAGERSQGKRRGPVKDALIHYYFTGKTLSIPKTAQIAFDCIKPSIDKSKTRQASYAYKFVNNSETIGDKLSNNFLTKQGQGSRARVKSKVPTPGGGGQKMDFEIAKSAPPPPPPAFPSLDSVVAFSAHTGIAEAFGRWWHREMTFRDCKLSDGSGIDERNWRAVLRAWWRNVKPGELKDIEAEESREAEVKAAANRVWTAQDWDICAERCRHFDAEKLVCRASCKTPPKRQTPPIPPQKCAAFEWLPGGEEAYKRENEEFERQLGAAAKILGIKTPTNSATR